MATRRAAVAVAGRCRLYRRSAANELAWFRRWPHTTKATHTSGSAQTTNRRRPADRFRTGSWRLIRRSATPGTRTRSSLSRPAAGRLAMVEPTAGSDEPGRLYRHDQRDLGSARLWLSDQLQHRPGTIAAEIVAMVAASQTIQSADGVVPAVIGEYGPEGSNGMQTVTG